MPDPLGTIFIDFNNLGTFTSDVDKAVEPINKLNQAAKNLVTTLNKLQGGGGTSGLGALKKVAGDLGDIVKLINTQESLGRGNLENISRTATTMRRFVELAGDLDAAIGAGGFKNIKDFAGIMKSIGSAFSALDKIKRPANLVVIQNAVDTLIKVLDTLERAIPRSGRFSKFDRVRSLIKNLAEALSAFDAIKRPENMQAATAGVLALTRTLQLLEEKINFSIIDRINRGRKLGQVVNIAKSLAKAFSAFDQIKRPESLEKITPAINAFNRVITSLLAVSESGTKLARGGLSALFGQSGTLLEGFNAFTKQLSKSLTSLAKFNKNQIRSLDVAASMFTALVSLMRLFSNESDVMLRGGDVIADFAQKGIDTTGFKEVIDELIDVAQYISKARFDPNKVLAIGDLFSAFNKLPSLSMGRFGGSGSGIFSSLKSMASNAINATISVLRNGAKIIGSIFTGLFTRNPFQNLIDHARQSVSQISQSMRSFGREMAQTGLQLLTVGGVAGFLQSQQVGMAMDFEAIMKQIEVLGGVTGRELEKANQLILQLGESSVFSASEVAAAFLDLSKAGLSVDQISASMESMLNLAAAGEISVADASNLVINAVGAMGLGFEDATMIADTFVAAANVGVATVADLAAAFGYVGNTAGAMGQDLDQVTAALTLMIDKGIESTRAGTALDALMRTMIDPSNEAREVLGGLTEELINMGLVASDATIFADSQGNFRDLNEIIKLITLSTQDYSEAGRALILEQISGSANAGRALLSLTETYEDGTLALDSYIAKQGEAASASEVGAALMDTTRGSLEELSGAFETLLLKALQPVLEYGIRPMIQGLTFIVRQISKLPEPVLAGAAAFIGLSTVLITLTGGFMLFSGIITQLIGFGLVPLANALWALANPLKMIMMLSAGKGLLFALFGGALFIVPLILTIVGGIRAFKDGLQQLAQTATGQGLFSIFGRELERLKAALSSVLQAAGQFVSVILQLTSPGLNAENQGLVALIITQITRLMGVASNAIEPIADLFNMLSSMAFVKIPGLSVSAPDIGLPQLPSASDLLEESGLTKEAFAEAFSVPLEDLAGTFSFDVAKDWLIMNSSDYGNEITKLREMADAAGGISSGLGAITTADVSFLKKTTKVASVTTKELRRMDDVLKLLDEDSAAFKTLSSNLEPFADNPIIEFIFGKNVTGSDLARSVTQLITLVANLRSVGSRTLQTFANFFTDLRSGIGVVQSFKNLVKGLLIDAGMLAAVFLDVTTSLLGLKGFDSLIANLASGNLRGALGDVLVLLVNAMIDAAQSALIAVGKVLIWSWQQLVAFEDQIDWGAVMQAVADAAVTAWNTIIKPVLDWSWDTVISFGKGINWESALTTAVAGAETVWNSLAKPTLTWAWDTIIDFKTNTDWSGIWKSFITTLENFIFGQIGGTGSGGTTATAGSASGSNKPITLNLGSIIGFSGFQGIVDAFTGEWALAEDAIKLLSFTIDIAVDLAISIKNLIFGKGGTAGGAGGAGGGVGATGGGTDWGQVIGNAIEESVRGLGYITVEIAEIFFDMDRTKWRANVDKVAEGIRSIFDSIASFDPGDIPVLGPIWDNLIDALGRLAELDTGSIVTALTLIGGAIIYFFGPALATLASGTAVAATTNLAAVATAATSISVAGIGAALFSASVALFALGGALAVVSGTLAAFSKLVDAVEHLAKLEVGKAFQDLLNAVLEFWRGASEPILQILDFFASMAGFENVFTEEKFQAGLDAWSNLLNGMYYLFLEKLAIPLGEKIQDLLSFGGLTIKGIEVVPEFNIELPGLTDAQAALESYQIKMGIIPPTAEQLAEEAANFDWSAWDQAAANYYTGRETSIIPPEAVLNTEDILAQLNTLTSSPETTTSIVSMLTGKDNNQAIMGTDIFDTPSITTTTGEATSAVTNFATTATTEIGSVRSQLQGLTSDWSQLGVWAWTMTITPMVVPPDPMAPAAQPRAKGGDVFPHQLYEVAEQGMSELLRIQGRTFLIPGEKGTVIPAEASPAPSLVPNTNYSANQTPSNGISYVDNSYLVIDVQGSNLSQEELKELTQQIMNEHETDRARSIHRRLRAAGR